MGDPAPKRPSPFDSPDPRGSGDKMDSAKTPPPKDKTGRRPRRRRPGGRKGGIQIPPPRGGGELRRRRLTALPTGFHRVTTFPRQWKSRTPMGAAVHGHVVRPAPGIRTRPFYGHGPMVRPRGGARSYWRPRASYAMNLS